MCAIFKIALVSLLAQMSLAAFPYEPGFDFQYRLPRDWQPIHYRLKIMYEESATTVPAQVTIKMMARRPTEQLVLNAFSPSIDIKETRITSFDNKRVNKYLARPISTQQTVSYALPGKVFKKIDHGIEMTVVIKYTFTVNETAYYGPYRNKYRAFNSEDLEETATRVDLFTQLEPFYARRLFPCFDEPEYKAIFYLDRFELRRKTSQKAVVLFNTHGERTETVNQTEIWTFPKPTPKMSPYLVAILVGNYESFYTDGPLGGTPPKVTFWYKASVNLTESVLQSRRVIGHYERYFNVQSPIQKFDFAFVPFAFFGMENWGLIGMKNIFSLSGDNSSMSAWSGESTLIHEILHQWFGNMITCRWWTDIWINEGLTSFYTNNYLENIFKPTVENRKYHREGVMYSMNAIRLGKFGDSWSPAYEKSPFILRMLQEVMGEEIFLRAIKNLLEHYAYDSVTTDDFFRVFQREVDSNGVQGWDSDNSLNVRLFLYNWLFEGSYPTVKATWDNSTEKFTLHQSNSKGIQWYIPIWLSISDYEGWVSNAIWIQPNQEVVLDYELVSMPISDPEKVQWDPKVIGFYSVENVI